MTREDYALLITALRKSNPAHNNALRSQDAFHAYNACVNNIATFLEEDNPFLDVSRFFEELNKR